MSDPDRRKTAAFKRKATVISSKKIMHLAVDVLSPCGPAYIINKKTIPTLRCRIIAGGANCQLEDETKDDEHLRQRGILIAPDYVINAGGVMQGIEELKKGTLSKARARLPLIEKNLLEIYTQASKKKSGTYSIAKAMALKRLSH